MAGMTWGSLYNPTSAAEAGFSCASRCKYVKDRKKAQMAKVTIMTYQLYHYQVNVNVKMAGKDHAPFFMRNILFCDECHNIPEIMKNNFAPEIKFADLAAFKTIYNYKRKQQLDFLDELSEDGEIKKSSDEKWRPEKSWDQYEKIFTNIWETLKNPESTKVHDFQAIQGYSEMFKDFINSVSHIEGVLKCKKQVFKKNYTPEDLKNYRACSYLRNCMCFWNDFYTCLAAVGEDYAIKEIGLNKNTKSEYVKFNIVKEDYISFYFLLSNSPYTVLMSATTGGFEAFSENVGLKYYESLGYDVDEDIDFQVIPSTFDFSKSPVYFLNRYKMSYREKETSFPRLKNIIYKICETKFPNSKGMIQTGSYQNAKEIFDSAPKEIKSRLLLYDGSRDKADKITLHQMSKNTILIGPTLVEGIDLPGEDCRFIIILKVPYPVIVDKYVKQKMQLFPSWYNSTTSNTIIQGIGRGNRFKQDFCTTYILDACFLNLYNCTKSQYPKELQKRIQIAG
jgi:Rad3-related DNA helicase